MTLAPHVSTRQRIATLIHDPSDACRWMRGINGPHELEVPRPRELAFRHEGTALGNVALGIIEYSTRVNIRVDDLAHSYSISLPLSGEQHIEYARQEFASDRQVGAIISPNQPLHLNIGEDCRKQLVRLSREAVHHRLGQLLGRKVTAPVVFDPRMPLEGHLGDWWKTVAHLQELLGAEGSLCDLPEVWGNFENSLITSLLYAQPHNYSGELHGRQQERPGYLDQLERMMRESLDQPLTLGDLEKASGVSRERLYQDFHAHFGTAPIAHFRNLRFDWVKRRLEHAGPRESVSSIAMDCGFLQLGRFSKEYQKRFGERPSQAIGRHAGGGSPIVHH
ncbi:AraC family transcriptional regulator [Halomonas beimenensis]|uniref:AraC-type DNA-binding domain and AraC-containing protein n=1 Tax=Halomonas beimenensis TaxID=475662 RepID=A0A291P3V8_9GAMM|nr:AraC family transcriptional regulator [Halomonas beimenensis]ATJ81552.1 AraC-type DNA-binding domain and AraC-containing protein [Halomonas beimenensis]